VINGNIKSIDRKFVRWYFIEKKEILQ